MELAKIGRYQGIDLDVVEAERNLINTPIQEIEHLMQLKKLRFGGWHLPIDFLEGEAQYLKDLQKVHKYARIAAALNCRTAYSFFSPSSKNLKFEENFDFHVKRLKPIARILSQYGCSWALEFDGIKTTRDFGRYEFIHNIGGTLDLIREIGEENIGLLLDSWHWYGSHGTKEEIETLKKSQVLYVHINDAPPSVPIESQIDFYRCLPGETGIIDLVGFMQSLKKVGYDGPVTPEPFPYNPLMSSIFLSSCVFNVFPTIHHAVRKILFRNFWRANSKLGTINIHRLFYATSLLRRYVQVSPVEAVILGSMSLDKIFSEAGILPTIPK